MKLRKSLLALGAAAALALTACSGETTDTGDEGGNDAEPFEIGVIQYVSHDALDDVTEGFLDELEQQGYGDGERVNIDLQNPQGDQGTLTATANQFAQDGKDLVLGVATPAAQALAQALPDTPVVFAAVTDPVAADLVDSWDEPGGNVTGMSDMNPVDEQLKLLLELDPDIQTVGIVYSSGEINAEVQVEAAEEAAEELGLTIKKSTVSNSGEVQQAAESLKVDAYYVPTDNNVVAGLEGLIQIAEKAQVPVVSTDEGSVERGAIAAQTVNYEQQGRDVANMAIEILEGADPAEMPVQTQDEFDLNVNPDAAERMGVEIPDDMMDRAVHVFD